MNLAYLTPYSLIREITMHRQNGVEISITYLGNKEHSREFVVKIMLSNIYKIICIMIMFGFNSALKCDFI